jgi:hypothetical protein
MRILIGALASVALTACGLPLPAATEGEFAPVPDGPIRFETVQLADGGLSVRADFVGGREFDPADPCSVAYEGAAEIVDRELVIGIFAKQHPMPLAPNQGCDAMGHSRSLTFALDEPFEGSVVRDLAGGALFLEPPTGLATIGLLPEGWLLRREENVPHGTAPRWERTWSPDPDPWPAEGDSMLTLLQAFGGPVEATGAEPQPPVRINGQEAEFWIHPPTGEMVLVWSFGDDEVALVGYLADFTQEEFVDIAESVRKAGSPSP